MVNVMESVSISTPIQSAENSKQPADEPNHCIEISKNPVASFSLMSSHEISKRQLLELSKKDGNAHAINFQYNEMNTFLMVEMRRAQGKMS